MRRVRRKWLFLFIYSAIIMSLYLSQFCHLYLHYNNTVPRVLCLVSSSTHRSTRNKLLLLICNVILISFNCILPPCFLRFFNHFLPFPFNRRTSVIKTQHVTIRILYTQEHVDISYLYLTSSTFSDCSFYQKDFVYKLHWDPLTFPVVVMTL